MIAAIAKLLPMILGAVGKAIPDPDLRAKIEAELKLALLNTDSKELEQASKIIVAEASGEGWLQRSWRPVTMLTFVALVVAHWLGWTAPGLSEAQTIALLEIVKIGLGGYVVGRSAEKAVKAWKEQ